MEFKEFIKERIKILKDNFGTKMEEFAPVIAPTIFVVSFIIVYFYQNIFKI